MSLQDHPGYFGMTSRGVIATHADWPIYPEEHGSDLALMWLTAFPPGTAFKVIDDIDRCNLFLADVKCSNRTDPFDDRNFHIAIWHEDLLALHEDGFIEGIAATTRRRWEEIRRSELPPGPLFIKLADGTFKEIELPSLDDFDDDEDISWPEFPSGSVIVTPAGRAHAAAVLSESSDELNVLGDRIHRLIRGQIRLAFKFIRNDFMHNFVDVDDTQARAVLFRIARVQAIVEELTA